MKDGLASRCAAQIASPITHPRNARRGPQRCTQSIGSEFEDSTQKKKVALYDPLRGPRPRGTPRIITGIDGWFRQGPPTIIVRPEH